MRRFLFSNRLFDMLFKILYNQLFILLSIIHIPSVSMKVIHGKSNIAMPVNPRNCQPADSAPALGPANNRETLNGNCLHLRRAFRFSFLAAPHRSALAFG
jgi:hypothetical protein